MDTGEDESEMVVERADEGTAEGGDGVENREGDDGESHRDGAEQESQRDRIEEAEVPRGLKTPGTPSQRERDDHELTHCPYRS